VKITLAQLNYRIGDFEANTTAIIHSINKARNEGADLVVFAELSVCGYPPLDFLEFDDFIEKCEHSLQQIAVACSNIACIVGAPVRNHNPKGKPLYNAAVFCFEGKTKVFRKALLPNYDVFDEYRYFEPAKDFELLHFKGKKIALTICEDIWDVGNSRLYTLNPMEELWPQQPDLMINIAASPFHYNQAKRREEVLKANVSQFGIPLVYVNQVGAQTELIFDGDSMVINEKNEIVYRLKNFEEDSYTFDIDLLVGINTKETNNNQIAKTARIHDALVLGIRDYFTKSGFSKAIVGLSGGIDSAVTLALAAKALGNNNIYGLLMPSQFSSDHSVNDAFALANNLGCPNSLIAIEDIYNAFDISLQPIFNKLPFNITEENIQARIRGVLLMAISNKFGYILLNTSNKSEAAVGYGTLYGDMNGGLSVLGDVYKTEVYELADYINRNGEIIPQNSIVKPPSAELRPNQKDSDSLPDYPLLDSLLFDYIEQELSPKELIMRGHDEKLVARVLRLVNLNEYKRHQTPPILRVSPKAFGMGRRMPIVAKYLQ